MPENFHVHELRGSEVTPHLHALGGLRIRVFRDYPYLYDGTLEYEMDYLKVYQDTQDSLVVLVMDDEGNAVGATTCLPLAAEGPEFRKPFEKAGIDPGGVMYFGESILLSEWRGLGIGKLFFDRRESHARALGKKVTAFCAVDRADDHPLRPAGYRPLDTFWQSRGYVKQPGLQATFIWKETGEDHESPKTLTFWTRPCAP
ncbi:MAG: GNAT family N-acetyltransferase [Verrucomicrobiaceae bacterium]|nr:MAG: GNAT family N-acetyltransferase [Verrucomicrobiaceae bacterium]